MRRITLLALFACQACKQAHHSGADAASEGMHGVDSGSVDDAGSAADATLQVDAGMADDDALGDASVCLDAAVHPDAAADAPQPAHLALVAARDHIEGFFLTPRTITADATRIYLASRGNNKLFVLARDRSANFPLIQTVTVGASGMSSVEVDATHVRVISVIGEVFVYAKGAMLTLESTRTLAPRGYAEDSAWAGNDVFVADGTAKLAASSTRVFVNPLNEGDRVDAFDVPSFAAGKIYSPPLDFHRVFAFDRASGAPVGNIATPNDIFGNPSSAAIAAG